MKIVRTENTPPDLASKSPRRQTRDAVESRDFVALDPVEWEIREDFALTLHKKYTFKRGELEPAPADGVP